MNDAESHMPTRWMAAGLVVGIALLSSFIYATSEPNQPKPRITLGNGYEISFAHDLNRMYVVNATVKNSGADGWVKVSARIYVAGRYMRQDQRIYLASSESKSLQFVFDISFWGAKTSPSVSYRVWAVAD